MGLGNRRVMLRDLPKPILAVVTNREQYLCALTGHKFIHLVSMLALAANDYLSAFQTLFSDRA